MTPKTPHFAPYLCLQASPDDLRGLAERLERMSQVAVG